MILAMLFANFEGNILVERFNGVSAEERLHWRSFLVKLGADNLKGVKNEELLVASHKYEYLCSRGLITFISGKAILRVKRNIVCTYGYVLNWAVGPSNSKYSSSITFLLLSCFIFFLP
ncbi:hypothetical protein J1N35_000421 [Gossypium stocksii]|uniref:Coatomer subunit zeta n=1 Tax=Gossypium stocksii TaxID=47602 RepID=A0A9D3WIR1_9ROSI|nr:hypothetical protein J1N35_000421 [Gossypium stocksii]